MRKLITDRLAASGFKEGGNLQLIERYAEGRVDRFPALAGELAKQGPDVVIAHGTHAVEAVRDASPDVPIVFAFVSDPVASGLVAELGRPGGRMTGFSNMNYELVGKRLEVLREAFPSVEKVAVLHDPQVKPEVRMLEPVRKAAAALRIELILYRISRDDDHATALSAMEKTVPDALLVFENIVNVTHRERIFEFARRRKVPAIYGFDTFVEAGGLMSYCAPNADQVVGAADYAARILRGARIRDLPIRLPSRFELVVNVGEARRSGIPIAQSVLLRADRIIE